MSLKRILKYLLGTINVGLWYPRNVEFNLVGYFDADFADSLLDHKSTSRTSQFLGNSLVSWFSKKKIPLFYSLPKRNILRLLVVVHKFFG